MLVCQPAHDCVNFEWSEFFLLFFLVNLMNCTDNALREPISCTENALREWISGILRVSC